jgi:FMN phosphatase YigB (HAD superfamily)
MQDFKQLKELSDLPKTWIFDLDGTILHHNSNNLIYEDVLIPGFKEFCRKNISKNDYILLVTARKKGRLKTILFLWKNKIRYNKIVFGLPFGERILFNDIKPTTGLKTAYAINVERNLGFTRFVAN